MDSKVISISVPVNMLRRIDEAAAATYQTRSNFIRMAIVQRFGAKSQFEFSARFGPDMRTDKQLANMYDYPDEYDEYLSELEKS
jgi:hypothetical protein